MLLLNRLTILARRKAAARRLGISFTRAGTFTMPEQVRIDGRLIDLQLPNEHGVRIAFAELLLDDCYRLRWLVRQGETVARIVDIGANVGLFSMAARNAFSNAVIHAYEPNRTLEPYLSHQSRKARVEVFYEAVGREAGRVSLTILDEAESVHTASRSDPAGTIPQIALRKAIKRMGGTVDLLKIDCEGAEWEMLEDPESWRPVRYVTMEYHLRPSDGHDAIVGALARCGFSIQHHRPVDTYGLVFARNERPL